MVKSKGKPRIQSEQASRVQSINMFFKYKRRGRRTKGEEKRVRGEKEETEKEGEEERGRG